MRFTFESGTRPLEGYTIKRAIYRGGFGEVYYAVSDEGREVALKLLQHNSDVELRGVRQCFNLSHPNLVTIFDIRQDDADDYWIVMEYVDGDTLDQAIRQEPNGMTIGDAAKWLDGITRGVEYLHSRGLVHRDLKPGNIFRSGSTIKVGDVGLSKFVTPSRRSAHTQSVGTVYYMAPEVAKGQYGREVDVYATGVILYEMLTGSVPFDGESTAEILMKHLTEKPDLTLLPPSVREVVARALEKEPANRYSSMTALWTAFSDVISGRTARVSALKDAAPAPMNGHHSAAASPVMHTGGTAVVAAVGTAPVASPAPKTGNGWREILRNPWSWPVLFVIGMLLLPMAVAATSTIFGMLVFGMIVVAGWKLGSAFVQGWRGDAGSRGAPPPAPMATATAPVSDRRGRFDDAPAAVPRHAVVRRAGMERTISFSTRCLQFSGSAVVATFCSVLLTGGLIMFQPEMFLGTPGEFALQSADPAIVGLFGFTTIAATWTIMLLTKLLEGRRVDDTSRRLLQAASGCLVGAASWVAAQFLLTGVPDAPMDAPVPAEAIIMPAQQHMPPALWVQQSVDGVLSQPALIGCVLFFAALFGLRRWWHQTDEMRPYRFRLASVLLTMALAFVICQFVPFPDTWGVALAAVISSVVQVSSVWQPQERRLHRVPHGDQAQVVA